jgi:hypothetical protein
LQATVSFKLNLIPLSSGLRICRSAESPLEKSYPFQVISRFGHFHEVWECSPLSRVSHFLKHFALSVSMAMVSHVYDTHRWSILNGAVYCLRKSFPEVEICILASPQKHLAKMYGCVSHSSICSLHVASPTAKAIPCLGIACKP